MTTPKRHAVVTPEGRKYLEMWQDGQLRIQLLGATNTPIVTLDIQALQQMIEGLIGIYNEVHPSANLGQEPETIVEGFDEPTTKQAAAW